MEQPPQTIRRATILVVDDTPQNLSLMRDLLEDCYNVKLAPNGARALKIANNNPPDLILLDIMMPDLSGYDVLRSLKASTSTHHIPVIFLTAMADIEDEHVGLSLGAVDYITKPISPSLVLARIKTQLENKQVADFLRQQNTFLEAEVSRRTSEISAIQDVAILALASLAETRDNDTGNHIRRTQHYVRLLATKLQTHPRFGYCLTDKYIDLLFKSAPLHDIGKIGIPDHILLKPGRFEQHEFEIMKTHTTIGRNAIENAERQLGVEMKFLEIAKEIAYSHQEKWDGSGYPLGLAGDAIPISARLMALADVYDALVSKRVYKEGFDHGHAVDLIVQGSGQHFDADIVIAFLELEQSFIEIASCYRDRISAA